jgi:hemoglobin-like flavoprotein
MPPAEIDRVQSSFRQVAALGDTAAELFYARLFAIDPALWPLFKGDMATQGRKLMAALAFVAGSLNASEKILPVARDMGVRHVAYGVERGHYATVGQALIETLEAGLGADFDAATRDAWTKAYAMLSQAMIEAAYAKAA